MEARARRQDPVTSHAAAFSVEVEGKAKGQRNRCLAHVRLVPGETAAEIAMALGMERHVPSRRLPELRDQGRLIENGPARKCRVMGRLSMTWNPAGKAIQMRLFD